jgi:hypothetical protein
VDANMDRVGIGYQSPSPSDLSSSLHINGDLTVNTNITASGNISASNLYLKQGGTLYSSADTNVSYMLSNGGHQWEANSSDTFLMNENQNNADFRFSGGSDVELFRIDAGTDKIGIGVAAPQSKLHIIGDIFATTHITASANISSNEPVPLELMFAEAVM